MIPMLMFAAMAAAVAGLLAVRVRQGRLPRHLRVDRAGAWAFGALAAALALGAGIAPVRDLTGFEMPPQCLDKPHGERAVSDRPVSDRLVKAELQRQRFGQQQQDPMVEAERTRAVSQLTGPGSVNATDRRWQVHGTDLGFVLAYGDRYALVFGDTFGDADRGGRRSNVLAWARRGAPDELAFTGMKTGPSGEAWEVLGSIKLRGWEETVIPTNGIAVGDRIVLHYMSVTCWGVAGRWAVDHAGLAVSDDGGSSFRHVRDARWSGDGPFAQVAFVADGGHVYAFGIPAGRDGAAHLARVPREDILDGDAWRYWDGSGWSADRTRAAPVVQAPVGELSVQWQDHHGTWLMLYLDEERGGIVLRTASRLTGPWSGARLVASAVEFPTLYAPFLVPEVEPAGTSYFTMSRFDAYNVFLMGVDLRAPTPRPGRSG